MKISLRVKANSKAEKVEKINDNEFVLRVKAPAVDGRANQAAIDLLARYLNVPKSKVEIIHGHKSKNKIISISE